MLQMEVTYVVDWNHNGERDSFDFAMDMMAMEEMDRASSGRKRKGYSRSMADVSWSEIGCLAYGIFFIVFPVVMAIFFIFMGEGDLFLLTVGLAIVLNYAIYRLVFAPPKKTVQPKTKAPQRETTSTISKASPEPPKQTEKKAEIITEIKANPKIVEPKLNAKPNIEAHKVVQKACQDSQQTNDQLSTFAQRKQDITDTEYGKIIYAGSWTFIFRAEPLGGNQVMNQQCKENKAMVYWHDDIRDYVYFEYISGCELFVDGQRTEYCGQIPMNPYFHETRYHNVTVPHNGLILRFVTGNPRALEISTGAKTLKELYSTIAYVIEPSGQSPFAAV